MKKIGFSELYRLCNKEQFFTCGTVQQYDKMFELAEKGIDSRELTQIIYICSTQSYDYIANKVTELFID